MIQKVPKGFVYYTIPTKQFDLAKFSTQEVNHTFHSLNRYCP